jgi:uncharacterized membrane protein
MSMGKSIPIVLVSTAIAGMLIVICGNYMPKCKRNYTIGIKLPWTLDSEDNWNHTHRFSGFVWTIVGIFMIFNAFLQIPYMMIGLIVVLVVVPFVYSYLYYRRHLIDEK